MHCKCCNKLFNSKILSRSKIKGRTRKTTSVSTLTSKVLVQQPYETLCSSCYEATLLTKFDNTGYYEDSHEYHHLAYEDVTLIITNFGYIGIEEI